MRLHFWYIASIAESLGKRAFVENQQAPQILYYYVMKPNAANTQIDVNLNLQTSRLLAIKNDEHGFECDEIEFYTSVFISNANKCFANFVQHSVSD